MSDSTSPSDSNFRYSRVAGRGAQTAPKNRFEAIHREEELSQLAPDDEYLEERQRPRTDYYADTSRSIIAENDSPDIPFRYSLNPYRGCAHGCAYCFARNSHEYLGFSAGLDFETKILIKPEAPELFHEWLARDRYIPDVIAMSGVTDCYQPIEKDYRLTRGCLEVAASCRQPMAIVTKNRLVTRDLDLFVEMANTNTISVAVSITSLDQSLTRTMEPRTSSPAARLEAIRELSSAGVPVHLMAAPMIPGLNDDELPSILKAGAEAGARTASFLMLRLPLTVKPVFVDWLHATYPARAQKVISRIRSVRDGGMNSSNWGERMKGTGPIAEQLQQTFEVFTRKLGLDRTFGPLDASHFQPPKPKRGQLKLFS
ncbi:MAG: PA0069 family radical SAM protein [Planctomycetaceae bacterium]|nr:PA0069 family radical SAM protein [Planctomycetaceae bacterium]